MTYMNDSADFRVHAVLQRSRPQGLLGDPRRPAQRHAATHTHTGLEHGRKDGVRTSGLASRPGTCINPRNRQTHLFNGVLYDWSSFTEGRTYSVSLSYSI